MEGSQGSEAPVPRWVWGLAIGVPVAAALAYILLGPDSTGGKGGKERKVAKEGVKEVAKEVVEEKVQAAPVEAVEEVPSDPFEAAVAAKNRGNKYFRGGRYELAIRCYSEAIAGCPEGRAIDLATFYQNRAAAHDQLDDLESVLEDCDRAVQLNSKYVKALDRRAKTTRKQAMQVENYVIQVEKLKLCLEDITSVCILEGFQKQEHLVMVDAVLKELGRAEAGLASRDREPVMTSPHFIQQYFTSFCEDPVLRSLEKAEEGDTDSQEGQSGYLAALAALRRERYTEVVGPCEEEVAAGGPRAAEARLLRATFYILTKQQELAMEDLSTLIADQAVGVKLRVNALIKRASLFIQQCRDPTKDPQLSFQDFAAAVELDPDNADIYHHRGQVHLLLDQMNAAIVDFTKAVTLQPTFPVAHVQKLYTDYRAANTIGDTATVSKVLGEFEGAVERFPKCVETYALFAQVLNDQQEFDRADTMYQRGLEVDPGNANLLVHRGLVALQSRGDVAAAVELIEQAIKLDAKCEFAYETLGTIEVQRGNLNKAIELFNKAIPLANTELEMGHLFGLRDAAMAQISVSERLGISLPPMGMMG